jgi:hypothetical protein
MSKVFDPTGYGNPYSRAHTTPGKAYRIHIACETGIHPAITVATELFGGLSLAQHHAVINKLSEVQKLQHTGKALAAMIKDWDVIDNNSGEVLPITADNILRLQPVLLAKLICVIEGYRATDPLPEPQEETEAT